MTLSYLGIGLLLTLFAALFLDARKRGFFLFTFSILAVYALQPSLPIRFLDFWLPTAALLLAFALWMAYTPREALKTSENFLAGLWLFALMLLLSLTRYLDFNLFLAASTPPRIEQVAPILLLVVLLLVGLMFRAGSKSLAWMGIVLLILLLVALKFEPLILWLAQLLRAWGAQSVETASALDIRWLGFSYIAFRLIHTLYDSIKGRAPQVSLTEYITFVFFYPALLAGPIDRLERFIKDLRAPFFRADIDWDFVVKRLALGLFKKFILADSLALMALNPQNASQIQHSGWAWLLLYAYALQIFLDFSGYTDLALALARLVGIKLPENFNAPYLRPNLTQFWNNWHMSLTQWFRAYVFNPFSRSLRSTSLPAWSMILLAQLLTMTLIGLWHGISLNFFFWGLWHALGLFFHNRWQDIFRTGLANWANTPLRQQAATWSGVFLTFHFVALGWVWFALPTPQAALNFFALLVFIR
jgi:alginate O-acetyltransferase complex protein AlgI